MGADRWYLVAALAIIAVQGAMIVALVLQRRRARAVQAALEENRQLTGLASTAAELGLERLRESEDNFRRLVESTSVVTWQADPDTWLFTYVGPQAVQLLGFPLERWYEKDFWASHIHPDDRGEAINTCLEGSRREQDFEFDYRMVRASGEIVWVHDIVSCQHQDGRPKHLRGLMFDITARKRSEQALRESEESLEEQRAFLRQVIDVNPNFIFAKDRDGRFTLANKAVADAYGVSVDDLLGRTDADVNPNVKEVAFFHRMDQEVMDTMQERFIPEEPLTDAQGKLRWLQTVKRPIVGSDGVARQVLGACTDITQRKTTEMELQEQRAALAHVARVALVGELATSLAHELNQPLTAILANARAGLMLLDRQPVDFAELRAALEDIAEADHRAAEVIRRARALVKKEDGPEFTGLDLASLLRDVVTLLRSDAMMHEVRVSLELDDDAPPVRGDRIQLQQVVLNIVMNAFDAMKACPQSSRSLALRMACGDGETIRVAVSDSGPGLDDEAMRRVFEPFYTTKSEGLGMGLPISRSIVESHGGRLWAENNTEGGATFYFTLPMQESGRSTGDDRRP